MAKPLSAFGSISIRKIAVFLGSYRILRLLCMNVELAASEDEQNGDDSGKERPRHGRSTRDLHEYHCGDPIFAGIWPVGMQCGSYEKFGTFGTVAQALRNICRVSQCRIPRAETNMPTAIYACRTA
jgi:hypothetical protein